MSRWATRAMEQPLALGPRPATGPAQRLAAARHVRTRLAILACCCTQWKLRPGRRHHIGGGVVSGDSQQVQRHCGSSAIRRSVPEQGHVRIESGLACWHSVCFGYVFVLLKSQMLALAAYSPLTRGLELCTLANTIWFCGWEADRVVATKRS